MLFKKIKNGDSFVCRFGLIRELHSIFFITLLFFIICTLPCWSQKSDKGEKSTEEKKAKATDETVIQKSKTSADAKESKKDVIDFAIDKLPEDVKLVEKKYGDSIKLVAYKINKLEFVKNDEITFELFWKCEKEMKENWMVTTHIDRIRPKEDEKWYRINADHYPCLGKNPTSSWKEGKIYKDTFKVKIPQDTLDGDYKIIVGFWIPGKDTKSLNREYLPINLSIK